MTSDSFLVDMGIRIARRRKEMGLTQEQLAERIGVSLQTISCIELGKKSVRSENLAKMCSSLDVNSDFILYGKRTEGQMNELLAKLSALDADAYQIVKELIDMLYERK